MTWLRMLARVGDGHDRRRGTAALRARHGTGRRMRRVLAAMMVRVLGAGNSLARVTGTRFLRVIIVCAVMASGLQLLPPGLPVPGSTAVPAFASTPVPPPAPQNPAPKVVDVTTPGPTQVTGTLTTDTVWSPQGSPYMVTGQLTVPMGVELTMLPGTVVKMGSQARIVVWGTLLALGDPNNHVVITSSRDDSVMGDSNGDGNATSPAPGDWNFISVSQWAQGAATSGDAVFDYADVKYGGLGSACKDYGEISASTLGTLVVSNSSVTESQNTAIAVGTGNASAGIYNNYIASSCTGVSASQPGHLDVIGNTFDMPAGNTALFLLFPQKTRVWFNTVNGLSAAAGGSPTTRAMADVRFNQLGGIYDYGAANQQLNDWSDNWWGSDANQALPACMDRNVAANSIPAISVSSSSTGCPSGQYQVTGYTKAVLPALSASPQVLPASLRTAEAPRFGPVDTYSGALTYQAGDMAVQDAGKTITASRTYRSDRLSGGDAGTGWRTSFDEAMSASGSTSTLSLPDGSSLGFATDPAAGYTPAPGVSADFSSGANGSTVTSPNQISYQFDPSGQLTGMNLGDPGHHLTIDHSGGQVSKVTGASGRYLSYAHSNGNLTSVTDQGGREVDLSYGGGGRLSSVTGVDGKTETYSYDSDGHLTQVTAPDGLVKLAAGYNADGRVAWIQQAGGGRTTFTYDDSNGKRQITLADGTVITQRYDWAGRLVSERLGDTGTHVVYDGEGHVVADITGVPYVAMTGYGPSASVSMYDGHGDAYLTVDPMGNATSTTFNAKHEPLVTTRPDGTTVSRTYDDSGRLTTLADPRGKTWTYTYNSFGEVTSQTDPLGRTRTIGYADNGDATSLTDETGATTHFGYDGQGLRTSVTDPLGNQTQATYTSWGALKTVTSPRGGVTSAAFDDDRRQTSLTNPLGVTQYNYGTEGRLHSVTDPLGGVTVTGYDVLGRPVQVTDARGSVSQRTYTPEGWVATSTDPDGKVTHYGYDPSGRPIRVTDPMGAVTQTVYDRNGNVIEVDRPDGSVQTWKYDGLNRVIQYTLPRGGVQKTTYDAAGNVTSVLGPRALATYPYTMYGVTATYDAAGRLATRTDALGNTTSYAYDDNARTVTATDSLGTVSVVTYDAAGRVASRTDGSGKVTAYGYNADGEVTSVTDPTGRVTGYGYNLARKLVSQTDPAGRQTAYDYDADGRLTKITYPAGDTDVYGYDATGSVTSHQDRNGKTWKYSYDPAGHLVTATDPLGHDTKYAYDDDGRQIQVTDPTGVETHTAYDPVGRPAVTWDNTGASWVTSYGLDGNVSSTADPAGVTWQYTYDKADQVTNASWVGVGNYSYSYDHAGNLTQKNDPYTTNYTYTIRGQLKTATDALGNATAYGYNGAGLPISVTPPSGPASTASYDNAGRISAATDGAGDTTQYLYDNAGQLATITLPRGGTYTYTYDNDGRLFSQTNPLTATTGYTFDGLGQPASISYPSGKTVTMRYDDASRLTSASDGTVTRSYGYDDAGRMTSASVTGQPVNPPALSWAYDNRGLMTSSTDALGTTTYSYDAAHRLTSRAPPSGTATTIAYNSGGLPSTISGPVSVSLYYNHAGQITTQAGGSDSPNFSYDNDGRLTGVDGSTATYNANGQIATLAQNPPGNSADNTTTVSYDNAGRLVSAALAQNGTTVSTTTYGWDADSNRTRVSVSGAPDVTFSYNLADQLTGDSAGTSYGYGLNGNLTTSGTTSYSYDAFGDLTGATTAAGSVSYAPDALGRLASRTAAGATQTFSYGGTSTSLAAQQSGGTTTNLVRDPAGMLLAEVPVGGAALRVNPTIHGDIGRLVNPSGGATAWSAVYDPFGTPATTGSAPVNLGFQSMYTDPGTGLVDMGARSYNPSTGTFTAADTVAGAPLSPVTFNRYLYGNGDPADAFDPTGQWSLFGTLSDLWNTFTSLLSDVGTAISQAGQDLSQAATQVAQTVTSAAAQAYDAAKAVAADAVHAVSQVAHNLGPTVGATLASVAVGGLVFLGCEAVTGGVGSVGCLAAGGAAGGALYGAVTCPAGNSTLKCAGLGALSGAAAGATAGLGSALGLGTVAAGALAGAGGNATSQLLTTGHINLAQLAVAGLEGALLGGAAKVLGARLGASDPGFGDPTVPPGETTPAADTATAAADQPAAPIGTGQEPATTAGSADGTATSTSQDTPTSAIAAEEQTGESCLVGGQSFTAKTKVLTATGALVAISKLRVGEKVVATNTKTGKTTAETVAAVLVHHDTDRYDLRVQTAHNTTVIDTTRGHLFWDQAARRWVKAGSLKFGTHLLTASGRGKVTVLGGWTPRQAAGWMWDLTITGDHDFYVQAAASAAVLVHNICVQFGQRRIGPNFSNGGAFRGRSIYAVAQDLKNGVLDPNGVKVNIFEHQGQLVAENNRSLAALSLAGLEPTNVNILATVPKDVLSRLSEEPLVGGNLPSSMTAVTPSQEDLRIGDIIQTPGG